MEGRTSFLIAHRLSTIHDAEMIFVMDHGRIVDRGTHEELLERGGLYRQLHDAQTRRRRGQVRTRARRPPDSAAPRAPDEELARRLREIWGAPPSGNGEAGNGA